MTQEPKWVKPVIVLTYPFVILGMMLYMICSGIAALGSNKEKRKV